MVIYVESLLIKRDRAVYQGKARGGEFLTSLFQDQDSIRVKHCWLFAAVFLILATFSSLLFAEETVAKSVGNGARYELIGRYDIAKLNNILTKELAKFTTFPVTYTPARNAVKLYRVTYPSVIPEHGNRSTMASGLVAIPETGEKAMPVISYQHGASYKKRGVTSFPDQSMETRLMIAQFAGQGYVVIGADYFGMGLSTEKEGILVKASQQQACIDLYSSAMKILDLEKIRMTDFFVAGWSQGGYVSLVFLEKLESLGIPVRAAATAAAASDPFVMINGYFHFPRKIDASWVGSVVVLASFAFEEYYSIPGLTQAFINPDQYETARKIYTREEPYKEGKLPTDLHKVFRPEYFDAQYFSESAFGKLLKAAAAYQWVIKTPLRNYYGDVDEAITIGLGKLPMAYQQSMGNTQVTALSAGQEADHTGAFVYAVAEEKKWFDTLLTR